MVLDDDEIILELDDGTVVKSRRKEKTRIFPAWRKEWAKETAADETNFFPSTVTAVKRVETVDGRVLEFTDTGERPYRAELCAELFNRTDITELIVSQDVLPVDVVASGKPAVAAYLAVAQGYGFETIGDKLDVSAPTVKQYLTDFRTDRR